MIINEEGTYILKYTATDECGKSSTVDRELVVTDNSPRRTVLYTDGTFIINERQVDEAHNIELHGVATNVYVPFVPNGNRRERYEFSSELERPWHYQCGSIKSVEIGSAISPTQTSYWFYGFLTCESIDLSLLDTSLVTRMDYMFTACRVITLLDLSGFDTNLVVYMDAMFTNCNELVTIYASSDFVVTQVVSSNNMFGGASNLVGGSGTVFNVSNPTDKTYAHIDGGTSNPGYFTQKGA